MPAATSHEDIYQTSSSGLSPASPSYLPDCTIFFDNQLAAQHYLSETPAKGAGQCRLRKAGGQATKTNLLQTNSLQRTYRSKQHPLVDHQSPACYWNKLDTYLSPLSRQPYLTSYQHPDNGDIEPITLMYDNLMHTHLAPPEFLSPMTAQSQHYLTIEELRSTRNSCWLCGCNWQEDHVSLDCPECGGYALSRPCPNCDGKCQQVWNRNINGTHDHHKALWVGQCAIHSSANSKACSAGLQINGKPTSGQVEGSNMQSRLAAPRSTGPAGPITSASSCCSSQPSSAASSDSESDDNLSNDMTCTSTTGNISGLSSTRHKI